MPANKKAFDIKGDDIGELSTQSETTKNQFCDYDENWLEESEVKLLRQIDDEKKANLIMSRMKKQMENH